MPDAAPQPEETAALVARAQEGDQAAFEELFLEMRPRLEGWITARLGSHLRTRLDIEDVVQEVQLQSFRSLGSFRQQGDPGSFWKWLGTIVNNRIRDLHDRHFRTQKRDPERERRLQTGLQAAITSPSVRARRQEDHELMLRALRELGASDREVIRLCTFDGLSYKEAAEVIGITPENVSARLSRAKARLGEVMRRLRSDST